MALDELHGTSLSPTRSLRDLQDSTFRTLVPHQLAAYAAIEAQLAAVIAERTGLQAHDLYPALTAAAVMSATRTATTRWLASDGATDLVAGLDEALDLLEAGLGHPPPP